MSVNKLIAMAKRIVSVALSKEVVEEMDQTTKALGMSRSEYVEMMIKKGFHFSDDMQKTMTKISKLQERIKDNFAIDGEKT